MEFVQIYLQDVHDVSIEFDALKELYYISMQESGNNTVYKTAITLAKCLVKGGFLSVRWNSLNTKKTVITFDHVNRFITFVNLSEMGYANAKNKKVKYYCYATLRYATLAQNSLRYGSKARRPKVPSGYLKSGYTRKVKHV